MATMEPEDPGSYGRVVSDGDGSVVQVVEAKGGEGDATPEELAIREVNTGVYAFDGGALVEALPRSSRDNAQGEVYLPDVLPTMRAAGDRSPRMPSPTSRSRSASTTAPSWPRPAGSPSSASASTTCARA